MAFRLTAGLLVLLIACGGRASDAMPLGDSTGRCKTAKTATANGVGLGYERFNNGVLLLIAQAERKVRIEVGCGLEDAISDQQAADIIASQIVPQLGAGDASAAVRDGMTALVALARMKVIPDAYRPANCSRSP